MIENSQDLDLFISSIGEDSLFLHIISIDQKTHPAENKISIIFIKHKDKTYWISFNHPDSICDKTTQSSFIKFIQTSDNIKWVVDKKSFLQLLPCNNLNDINLCFYLKNNTTLNLDKYSSSAHDFIYYKHNSHRNLNNSIPLLKHLEVFEEIYDDVKSTIKTHVNDTAYDSSNNIIIPTLSFLEKTGVYVDPNIFYKHYNQYPNKNNIVYTKYNLYTSTGRPSNSFNGINYAAVSNSDGSRQSFISRHGKDGCMIMIDYTAFHPHIICYLTKYFLKEGTDVYNYLAKLYFQVDNPTDEQVKQAKIITFRQLYGGIEDKYAHIKYLSNLKSYIYKQWEFFKLHKYIETPLFKRKITESHIIDPTPHKLFNYILQSVEGEIAISQIKLAMEYLSNKKSKCVLYTYDSILIDFHNNDGESTIGDLGKIISIDNKFPVKIYRGNSYESLSQII